MERTSVFLILGATVCLLLSVPRHFVLAGECESSYGEVQVMKFYLPPTFLFVAGPGAGLDQKNESAKGFGTVAVFDQAMTATPNENDPALGYARGFFILDSYSGQYVLNFYTLDIDNDSYKGSIVIAGSLPAAFVNMSAPIVGGSGDFAFVIGYTNLLPSPLGPGDPNPYVTTLYNEVHFKLPKSRPF